MNLIAITTQKATARKDEPFPFIPAALDDYGLTAPQFRVFCRISRRGICDESVPNMARGCRLSPETVSDALQFLVASGLINKAERAGDTNVYVTRPISQWIPSRIKRSPGRKGRPIVSGVTHPFDSITHPPQSNGDKGTPPEGTPFKEGAVSIAHLVNGLVAKASVRIANAPTIDEVRTEMERQFRGGGRYADSFCRTMSSNGWRDKDGKTIIDWKAFARRYASGAEAKQRGVTRR